MRSFHCRNCDFIESEDQLIPTDDPDDFLCPRCGDNDIEWID